MNGKKNDQDKVRMDLLPMDALYEISKVLTFGAKKYGDRNWEKGIDLQRFRGAILRHDTAVEMGEMNDPESGLPHLAHKACSTLMELALYLRAQQEYIPIDRMLPCGCEMDVDLNLHTYRECNQHD